MSDFPTMPQIDENDVDIEQEFSSALEMDKGLRRYNGMNDEQKQIVDTILKRIDNFDGRDAFYFLSGAGGVGKTHVNVTICNLIRGRKKKYSTMAFTGIAANLLPDGRTLHNRFGLNLDMTISKIGPSSKLWKELLETDIFIVDESPMIDKKALDVLDSKLREIMNNDVIFGGKIMLWTGDFRQTLPIKSYATRAQIVDSTLKRSKFWKYVKMLKLTRNMRALPSEQDFASCLLDIGEGKMNNENDEVILPLECISNGDLVEEIFGQTITSQKWNEMSKMAILAPKNVDVSEMNC